MHDDRETLKEIAADAGFDKDKIEIIDEITAAGYFFQTQVEETALPKDIIVVDVGGGSTDWLYLHLSESGRYGAHSDFPPRTVRFGGYHIDDYLADLVENRIEGNAIDRVYVRNQTRLHKEWYCMDQLRQTPVRAYPPGTGKDEGIQLDSQDIQKAINEAFVDEVSSELLKYAETVRAKTHRKPTFILTGGGATLKGLKESLDDKFAVEQPDRCKYATVLGALHYARNQKVERNTYTHKKQDQKVERNTYTHKKQVEPIIALTFSSKGELLAGASGENVPVWELADGNFKSVRTVLKHEGAVTSLAFSPDGRRIATATATKGSTINLWDTETGENIKEFDPQPALIRCIAFSPDGKHIASGDSANAVKVWDANTEKGVETFVGKKGKYRHRGFVNSVAFSSDGTFLASGGQDCVAKIWYVGREKKPLTTQLYLHQRIHPQPKSSIMYVDFLDESHLFTLGMNGELMVWRLMTEGFLDKWQLFMEGSGLEHLLDLKPDRFLRFIGDWARGISRVNVLEPLAMLTGVWNRAQLKSRFKKVDFLKEAWLMSNFRGNDNRYLIFLQGQSRSLIESLTRKIFDAHIKFPYTDSSCLALGTPYMNDRQEFRLIAIVGSESGGVQILTEDADLVTLPYP